MADTDALKLDSVENIVLLCLGVEKAKIRTPLLVLTDEDSKQLLGSWTLEELLLDPAVALFPSKTKLRQMIEQGGVSLSVDGQTWYKLELGDVIGLSQYSFILKYGKRAFARIFLPAASAET